MSSGHHPAGFNTRAIHHGYKPLEHQGALNPPIYLSSTFAFESAQQGGARFAGEEEGMIYTRLGNPTNNLLEERLASLEGGESAVVFSSGMGAITSTLWTLLQPGDEIITDMTLYGCTYAYFHHSLAPLGIRITHMDLSDSAKLKAALSPKTKVVYFETPANPNMRLVDIASVSEVVHRACAAVVIVDNTYCTPYLQQPLKLGADLVVHSATKYLCGHGDVMAGAVVGDRETLGRIRMKGLKDCTGAVLSPHDAYLLLRGMKTLGLRMDRHCENAQRVAEMLERHPSVARVYYPGLKSFEQYTLARKQMRLAGGMVAFELHGGIEAGKRFINQLELLICAVSLGDAETLVQHPASMTHSTYTPEERQKHLISEGLVRLSVGLEDCADIIADLKQSLDRCGGETQRAQPLIVSRSCMEIEATACI